MKTEELIVKYIRSQLDRFVFTYCTDIMEHSIWGFKGARYKNFSRARNKVQEVLDHLQSGGVVEISADGCVHRGTGYPNGGCGKGKS